MAQCAGPAYVFDSARLEQLNEQVEEMDRIEVIKLDSATVNYQNELVNVFRSIADPFANQLRQVRYEPNPKDASEPAKEIDFANEKADGFAEIK